HHLTLEKSILELIGNFGKVNPPLRSADDNQVLWQAVLDGTIDCIGSDHAPHTIDEKIENYPNAPSGFPGLETTLPILITEFNERKIPIERLVELTSTKPAEIFNFEKRGKIKEGYFADITAINTENEYPIVASLFQSKAKYSPFDGSMVKAGIEAVFVNGKMY
ncbi:MAG: dihydroorotase family protein, partial [Candidatus Cloacimonetes bacterium]|nr:dihydroorotase family protein [Candidatus Cloacimonadota bacterium]